VSSRLLRHQSLFRVNAKLLKLILHSLNSPNLLLSFQLLLDPFPSPSHIQQSSYSNHYTSVPEDECDTKFQTPSSELYIRVYTETQSYSQR
jgi:hypothetical protein